MLNRRRGCSKTGFYALYHPGMFDSPLKVFYFQEDSFVHQFSKTRHGRPIGQNSWRDQPLQGAAQIPTPNYPNGRFRQ
jgi:hypothetical protein